MERKIDDDVCRYDHMCAPRYLAAVGFSNTHADRGVLTPPDVMAGSNPVCVID
jgi:hypothetical protein